MRRIVSIFVLLSFAWRLPAQTIEPAKLALIAESQDASTASDVLTAQLSSNTKVHLLERDEIEKVYREQGLSAGNRDYLKLGRVLGADGLLLLDVVKTKDATNLTVRLIAVKPGVVLLAEKFSWVAPNVTEWTSSFANHLNPLLPKLSLLVKDAIPISVVNLRCATQSADAPEIERQLKLLTIQRLSRERQFFVLERQRMQLLGEEKELKLDDSAFWNGSYLLEGVIDQNGYARETITINARLTPPKGGAPLLLEVSGSRTNSAEVINRLAVKVDEALKINAIAPKWNTVEEAAQYFDEANWAVKWGTLPEAEEAADSAWALGKHDADCAIIRIKSYGSSPEGMIIEHEIIDHSTTDSIKESDRDWVITNIKNLPKVYPGVVFTFDVELGSINIVNLPSVQSLDGAIRALDLYRQFSATQFPEGAKADSRWYCFGVENLTAAAKVLQHFYLVPKSRRSELGKLADLRSLARSVAAWLCKTPTAHDSYFIIDPNPDKQKHTLNDNAGVFHCEANWGCFWQETPEDCVALYRDLLSSPAFSCFNDEFKSRGVDRPCLTAWNDEDERRVAGVWDSFVQELNNSSNRFLQDEAKIFQWCSASGLNEAEITAKYNDYWQGLKSGRRDTLAVEKQIQYLTANRPWDENEFIAIFSFRAYSTSQALKIKPLLDAYESNYVGQLNNLSTETFAEAIRNGRGDANQADAAKKNALNLVIMKIDEVQAAINRVLHLPATKGLEPVTSQPANRPVAVVAQTKVASNSRTAHSSISTNYLLVKQFLAVPQESLTVGAAIAPGREASLGLSNEKICDHSWREGKLLLDLRYYGSFLNPDTQTYNPDTVGAAAFLNPSDGHWEVILYPRLRFHSPSSMELFHGDLYLVDNEESILGGNKMGQHGRIQKYNFKTGRWNTLEFLDQGVYDQTLINQNVLHLSVVNNRLFAANFEGIYEITEDGQGMRILASTRRRPVASALDMLENLGSPVLRAGSGNSLQALIGNSLYHWNETDWVKDFILSCDGQREVAGNCIFFRTAPLYRWLGPETLWIMQNNQSKPELALYQATEDPSGRANIKPPQKPLWPMPEKDLLKGAALTSFNSNLYFLADHSCVTNVAGHRTAMEQDGYHAKLICLSHDCPEPIVIPLRFDTQRGPVPNEKLHADPLSYQPNPSACWMLFAGNYLFIAEEHDPGVWVMPVSEVEAAVAAQKQVLLGKVKREDDAVKQARKNLMAKYHRDQNGVLAAEDKERALADPAFIESELDVIDTNHNGCLDPEELVYFDANNNKILDENEQAGIEIAEHLFAVRLLKRFDEKESGFLNRFEFQNLFTECGLSQNADHFLNGSKFDLAQIESVLTRELRSRFPWRRPPAPAKPGQIPPTPGRRVDPRQSFKTAVEAYWQKTVSIPKDPPK